jgi:serine/threonine protein kinase
MKVFIKGKNKPIELNNGDFLAQGGEGKIYVKGDTVYKVCESGHMIPEGKFTELSVLTDPRIIKPEQIIVDSKGVDVGYSMKYLKNTYTLCQLFTKAFRLRNNIKPDQILDLVQQMQKTVNHVHSHDILIVDMNEFNFLVDDKFKDIYFIDVNSYQTRHYPTMAIMDSIRDRHNPKFSRLTDWFSFGVISFQMFIGIHPYKGKHPKYTDLDARMQHNTSVFDKDVGYPTAACQPFSVIPDAYLQWYKAIFDKGERLPPPSGLTAVMHVVIVPTVKVVGGKSLAIDKLREFPHPVIGYYYSSGREVFVTSKNVFVDKRDYSNPHEKINVGFTKTNQPIAAWIEDEDVKLKDVINDKDIPFTCSGTKMMDFDGRLYVQNGMNIIEIQFTEMGNRILASPHVVANVLEQSTRFFNGVIVQNLFDAYYVSFFPQSKQCQQVAIRELDGLRVIDAKYDNKIMMVVAVDKKGHYNRFTFAFKDDFKTYEVAEKKNVTYAGLNFTVMDNGVCINIDEDENVEIFNKLSNAKVVTDDVINHDMLLYHKGAAVMFTKDNAIYSVSMKKP